jgi:hypothetical protein
MAEPKVLSDSAIVLRGGRNRSEEIRRGIGTHPSGITGISVECEEEISVQALSSLIPHGQIGVTTEVRAVGGDVRMLVWSCLFGGDPSPQYFSHRPGLGNTTPRRHRPIAVKDFAGSPQTMGQ